jgi:DNA-binding PadR family transcriptional regulator
VSPVFGHGRLRLYLLKLLDESPRHGYEVIRLLEDRFMGLYAPSAGTVYPRLARLEEEGLVAHDAQSGRKVYRLTDTGREELHRRADELDALEEEISGSVHDLASDVRADVRASVRDLRSELKDAAKELRRQQRHPPRRGHGRERTRSGPTTGPRAASPATGRTLEDALDRFHEQARDAVREAGARHGPGADDVAHRVGALLDDTLARLRDVLP